MKNPALLAFSPGQCLLTTDKSIFRSSSILDVTGQRMFLRNLYLRATSATVSPNGYSNFMWVPHDSGEVWLEDVSFQGNLWKGTSDFWSGIKLSGNTTEIYAKGASQPSKATFSVHT
jgi:hypothetical protein